MRALRTSSLGRIVERRPLPRRVARFAVATTATFRAYLPTRSIVLGADGWHLPPVEPAAATE